MIDLNVILDVIQHREPHYGDPAQVVDAVSRNQVEGNAPSLAFQQSLSCNHG
jgi:hypothetical protein